MSKVTMEKGTLSLKIKIKDNGELIAQWNRKPYVALKIHLHKVYSIAKVVSKIIVSTWIN